MSHFVLVPESPPPPSCCVCGKPYAEHGSYPTCATHSYAAPPPPVAEVSSVVGGGPNDVGIRWRGGITSVGTKLYTSPMGGAAEGWRSIETAPKDGTEVLLWATKHTMLRPNQQRIVGRYSNGWWAGNSTLSHVTAWQPLAAAPQEGGQP